MLDGDDSDAGLVVALGGPAGQELIDLGIPSNQSYWLRVWAAHGLFWAWEDQALPILTDAAGDERWRVRGWVAKIIGKHGLSAAAPLLDRLQDDSVPRVRTAAQKASIVLADLR
jgi:hypothetical protein